MENMKENRLAQAIHQDAYYRSLLTQAMRLESEYARILDTLPGTDRELLEQYISLGEELEHRRVTLAMSID